MSTSFVFPSASFHMPSEFGVSHSYSNGPLLPTMAPKLPSLEGLLKRIHSNDLSDGASTDEESVISSCSSSPVMAMPSLRSILSPSKYTLTHSSLLHKRSWEESSQSSDASSDYMGSPKRAAHSTTSSSNGPQRSRASKYCKIDGCDRVSQRNNLCHSHGGKRLCKEDGCSSKDRGNGFCIKHGGGKICSIGGCEKKARRKGLCTQHFRVCDSLSSPFESHSHSHSHVMTYTQHA